MVRFTSPDLIDYAHADIDETLAFQIVSLLNSQECSIEDSKKTLTNTYILLSKSRFIFKLSESEDTTQQLSPGKNHAQSEEHAFLSALAPVGGHSLLSDPLISNGQNITKSSSDIDMLSREIANLMITKKVSFYIGIGTLLYAGHIINASPLSGIQEPS